MSAEDIPKSKRYITTHNSEGLAIFSSSLSDKPPRSTLSDGMEISFCYATTQFPARLDQDRDIDAYKRLIEDPPGIVISKGSAARIVDFPPNHMGTMHRTLSVNYNFVIHGQLELVLDSGETRQLNPGDMVVQRAINHAWRNRSQSSWARIAAVALPAEHFKLGDKTLEEIALPSMETSK